MKFFKALIFDFTYKNRRHSIKCEGILKTLYDRGNNKFVRWNNSVVLIRTYLLQSWIRLNYASTHHHPLQPPMESI